MRHSESVEEKRSVGLSSYTVVLYLGEERFRPSESVEAERSVVPSSLTIVVPFSLLKINVWGRRRYNFLFTMIRTMRKQITLDFESCHLDRLHDPVKCSGPDVMKLY